MKLSVITSVRSVEKAYHTSDFSLTSYHPETKSLINLKYKKGHNSGKIVKKSPLSNLTYILHKIHLHTTSSLNLTFRSYACFRTNIFVTFLDHKIVTNMTEDGVYMLS
jgi:hypothetical protein